MTQSQQFVTSSREHLTHTPNHLTLQQKCRIYKQNKQTVGMQQWALRNTTACLNTCTLRDS